VSQGLIRIAEEEQILLRASCGPVTSVLLIDVLR